MAFNAQDELLWGNYFYVILLFKSCPTTGKKSSPLQDGRIPTGYREMNDSRISFYCAILHSVHKSET